MDRLDVLLMFIRPIGFVLIPAWLFAQWFDSALFGAVLGFAYMWNFFKTNENAELAAAFKEVREELDKLHEELESLRNLLALRAVGTRSNDE